MRDTLSGILREFAPTSGESVSHDAAGGAKGVDAKGSSIKVQDVKTDKDDGELPIAKSMKIHPGKVWGPGRGSVGTCWYLLLFSNSVNFSQIASQSFNIFGWLCFFR